MKIMIAASHGALRTGGAEVYAWQIAQKLAETDQVALLALGEEREISCREENRVQLILLPQSNVAKLHELAGKSSLLKAVWHYLDIYNPKMVSNLTKVMREFDPDVLHTNKIDGFSHAIFSVAERVDIPTVHTLHDYAAICPYAIFTCPFRQWRLCPSLPPPCRLYMWGKRRFMKKKPDLFIAPSRSISQLHQSFGIVKNRKSHILPNAIRTTDSKRCTRNQKPFEAAFLGGFTIQKGIRVLLEAWESLPGSSSERILHFAGEGPLKPEVEAAAARDDSIHLHGNLTGREVEQLLNSVNLLLLPSLCLENSPMVIGEAFSSGIPVLASRIGGIPEFVEDDKSGILVDPGKPSELLDALKGVIGSSEKWERLSRGAEEAAKMWNLDTHIRNLVEIYASVTDG